MECFRYPPMSIETEQKHYSKNISLTSISLAFSNTNSYGYFESNLELRHSSGYHQHITVAENVRMQGNLNISELGGPGLKG